MAKDLLTIRCPDDLIAAIEQRMKESGKGKTDVVVDLLRSALGIPSTNNSSLPYEPQTDMYNERTTELDSRITVLVDEKLAPIRKQIEVINIALRNYQSDSNLTPNLESPSDWLAKQNPQELTAMIASLDTSPLNAIATQSSNIFPSDAVRLPSAKPLLQTELAERLQVTTKSVQRNKKLANFSKWSKDHDPDGVAWEYRADVSPMLPSFFPMG